MLVSPIFDEAGTVCIPAAPCNNKTGIEIAGGGPSKAEVKQQQERPMDCLSEDGEPVAHRHQALAVKLTAVKPRMLALTTSSYICLAVGSAGGLKKRPLGC
ncbi:hypothetical protein NDU88_003295 [Pleurodeles waltl]|uniref:Uncharacterized protein n=1 Tax=Pleurodeles waltl TaxID=8319 RepID=A0AAV7RDX9_PLEWA|nr:hypothetical protein NDU88_003295 [Pleurodeles waltl]